MNSPLSTKDSIFNMRLSSEIIKDIKTIFDEMQNLDDFLYLINYTNKLIYKNTKPVKMQYLTYYAYYAKRKYKNFTLQKKSGGDRTISAPFQKLKNIQSTIGFILQCVYKPQITAHGFTWNRSIVTGAKNHIKQNYLLNIDLEDFFTSIHKARVERRLQVPPFNLSGEKAQIATIIARIATKKLFECIIDGKETILDEDPLVFEQSDKMIINKKYAVLPQGAPTSPVLSNSICDRLDKNLMNLAKKFNAKYTRYADDITFSSMHNIYQQNSDFLQELYKIIALQNFKINLHKTRLQKRGYRQEVTGLIVNDKINVRRSYIKQLRALIYSVEKFGFEKAQEYFTNKQSSLKPKRSVNMLNVINGKLEYLKNVKGSQDSTYLKLKERFDVLQDLKIAHEKQISDKQVRRRRNTMIHDPIKLASILTSFSQNNNSLKYTTHHWDKAQIEERFGNYENFIEQLHKEWRKIKKIFYKTAPRLYQKIYNFLFNSELDKENSFHIKGWGIHRIEFGWSSPELKVWCSNLQNSPFDYTLPEKYRKKIGNKNLYRFGDVVEIFKNEIEVRNDNNQLKKMFIEKNKSILGFDFKIKYQNIEGIEFYTDVQWFECAIEKIFEEIKKRTMFPNIIIESKKDPKYKFIDIHIIQQDSIVQKDVEEMALEINSGDFGEIRNALLSLCDWSIEANFSNGNYRIDYLSIHSKQTQYSKLEYQPIGFTHILRFYR